MSEQSHSPIDNLITEHIDIWSSAIKRKSSSGRGSSKKIELYGIKKLRELILELAVRGKLVKQDPNDEPASVLLERIAAEKAELVKQGKIKQPKILPEISEEEKPFELPEGWEWSRIAELAEVGPRNLNVEDECSVSFIPMPLISTRLDGSHESELKQWKDIKKGYTHFANGDIAIAKITPCFENSKAAVFRDLESGLGAGTTELHVARPIPNTLNPQFVLLYLKAPMFLKVGETEMTGSAGQKRVPKDFFALSPLPFAPLAEQHRIVAKVDELMALCDQLEQQTESSLDAHQTLVQTLLGTLLQSADAEELEQNWQHLSVHFDLLFTTEQSIDQLKQAILQLAVMGKLVEQNPNDEPASELLKRIAAEKEELVKQKKIKKQKQLIYFEGLNDLKKPIPKSWEWVRLADIADLVRGGSPRPAGDPRFYEGSIPFLKVGDITRKKSKFVEGFNSTIKEAGLKKTRLIEDRTVLLSNSGATLGIPAICDFPATFNDGIAAFIEQSSYVSHEFLYLYLSTMTSWFLNVASRGQGQPNLNTDIIKATWFPLASLHEQHRIVAKVDELMAICDQLKARLNDAQTTQLNLADALVEQVL